MGYELFVGFRYLKAKRKQSFISVITFISIAGITVGVTALIIVLSVMSGFEEDLKEKILGINAHLVVLDIGEGMKNYETIAKDIRGVEGVVGATPYIYSQAMVSAAGGVMGVVMRGMDTATAGEVTILPERVKEGSLSALNTGFDGEELPGIAIGAELARNLGVSIGDEVNVISPTTAIGGGAPRMAVFKAVAIFELGMYEYDSSMVFVSLKNAQRFFRLGGTATGIEVKINDIYAAEDVGRRIITDIGGGYWVRTWMDMNRNLFSALRLEKVVMFIILMLIIFVAALNIISTLIMVVMEKGKDIAILKSMGATSGGIMKIFMIEGIVIGAVGTILGTVLGVLAAVNLEAAVSLIERVFDFKVLPPSVYYIDRLPSNVEPSVVVAIAFISLMISFLATIYPSWQASRLDPVEGLRYE
ncbi:MAG: lipoprotein-releasing ABC transporter permease subunit [Deltaproteobacteria bacterium]|nr:lipoprotein-releasing ABC transporter permease subunit [Deltaproteobacteria bacterium]